MKRFLTLCLVMIIAVVGVASAINDVATKPNLTLAKATRIDPVPTQPPAPVLSIGGGQYYGCPRIWKMTHRGMEVIGKEPCDLRKEKVCTNLVCMAK